MKPVEFLPAARSDFDESLEWYAIHSLDAAERFTEAVQSTLHAVAKAPERFALLDAVHRGAPIRPFPFRIIYRTEETLLLVVAVAHAKRRPGYWRNR